MLGLDPQCRFGPAFSKFYRVTTVAASCKKEQGETLSSYSTPAMVGRWPPLSPGERALLFLFCIYKATEENYSLL